MQKFFIAALGLLTVTIAGAPLAAQIGAPIKPVAPATPPELTSRDIIRALQMPLDMKDFQNPMTLREALGVIYEHVADAGVLGKGVGLPLLVDQAGFKEVAPDAPDIYDAQVKFPPHPKSMTVATALHFSLSQAAPVESTFVVRRGVVVITPAKQIRLKNMLKQRVLGDFVRKPLDEVIQELAEQTGVSIQLDSRTAKDKQSMQVTAMFRNDTSVRDALTMLADMAGLQVVELTTSVYVTTPANAELLRKAAPKK